MQCNSQIISLYKIAPMAIRLAAADVKVTILDLLPNGSYLLTYSFNISRSNNQLFFLVSFLFIGFDKIKLSAYYSPVFLPIIIDKYFIEYTLSPIITTIWIFIRRPF